MLRFVGLGKGAYVQVSDCTHPTKMSANRTKELFSTEFFDTGSLTLEVSEIEELRTSDTSASDYFDAFDTV